MSGIPRKITEAHGDSRPFTEADFIKAVKGIWEHQGDWKTYAYEEREDGSLWVRRADGWYKCVVGSFSKEGPPE